MKALLPPPSAGSLLYVTRKLLMICLCTPVSLAVLQMWESVREAVKKTPSALPDKGLVF